MEDVRRMTLQVHAPIEEAWAALADADGWTVDPAGGGRVAVVAARAPSRVSWHVIGRLVGTVEWELDDLDDVTFARAEWRVAPSRARIRTTRARRQRIHDQRVSATVASLGDRLGLDLRSRRGDLRHPRWLLGREPVPVRGS